MWNERRHEQHQRLDRFAQDGGRLRPLDGGRRLVLAPVGRMLRRSANAYSSFTISISAEIAVLRCMRGLMSCVTR
jgi:hypothetical protein